MFLVNGSLLMAPLFPRSGPGESGSPTSAVILRCYDFPTRIPGHLFVSLPGSTLSFSVRVSQTSVRAPGRSEGAFRARSIVQPTTPSVGLLSRGRERDLSGSQAIHPVPLPRSKTPAEPTIPRHWRFRRCCPRFFDSEGFSVRTISGLPRGFSTCCLRFTNGVATIHAKLASGWLAGLYREGVEPSGSRRKVSDFVLILLSWTFPDATKIGFHPGSSPGQAFRDHALGKSV